MPQIVTYYSYRTESSPAIEQERQRQRLASIVEQLRANSVQPPNQEETTPNHDDNADDVPMLNPNEPHIRNRNAEEMAELERLGTALRQISQHQQDVRLRKKCFKLNLENYILKLESENRVYTYISGFNCKNFQQNEEEDD
jgi:hypothetical protein